MIFDFSTTTGVVAQGRTEPTRRNRSANMPSTRPEARAGRILEGRPILHPADRSAILNRDTSASPFQSASRRPFVPRTIEYFANKPRRLRRTGQAVIRVKILGGPVSKVSRTQFRDRFAREGRRRSPSAPSSSFSSAIAHPHDDVVHPISISFDSHRRHSRRKIEPDTRTTSGRSTRTGRGRSSMPNRSLASP